MGSARFESMVDFGSHEVDVAIRCPACKHTRHLTAAKASLILGAGTRIHTAERRLRCSKCNHKGARLAPIPRLD